MWRVVSLPCQFYTSNPTPHFALPLLITASYIKSYMFGLRKKNAIRLQYLYQTVHPPSMQISWESSAAKRQERRRFDCSHVSYRPLPSLIQPNSLSSTMLRALVRQSLRKGLTFPFQSHGEDRKITSAASKRATQQMSVGGCSLAVCCCEARSFPLGWDQPRKWMSCDEMLDVSFSTHTVQTITRQSIKICQ